MRLTNLIVLGLLAYTVGCRHAASQPAQSPPTPVVASEVPAPRLGIAQLLDVTVELTLVDGGCDFPDSEGLNGKDSGPIAIGMDLQMGMDHYIACRGQVALSQPTEGTLNAADCPKWVNEDKDTCYVLAL